MECTVVIRLKKKTLRGMGTVLWYIKDLSVDESKSQFSMIHEHHGQVLSLGCSGGD